MSMSTQRNDLLQTSEDFGRVMEDYFAIIPPDLDMFELDKIVKWEFDDIENSMTFYFDDDWLFDEFKNLIEEIPTLNDKFVFDEYEHVNREKLTLTILGKDGGLM